MVATENKVLQNTTPEEDINVFAIFHGTVVAETFYSKLKNVNLTSFLSFGKNCVETKVHIIWELLQIHLIPQTCRPTLLDMLLTMLLASQKDHGDAQEIRLIQRLGKKVKRQKDEI